MVSRVPRPAFRGLRHFAFDPSFSRRIETYDISEVVARLPWEDDLKPGPVDDYLEVVDYDPASKAFYAPIDWGTHCCWRKTACRHPSIIPNSTSRWHMLLPARP